MESALHVIRPRRRKLWARSALQDAFTRELSESSDWARGPAQWSRILTEPVSLGTRAVSRQHTGHSVAGSTWTCNVSECDHIEEDLSKALEDLETEAHRCQLQSRSGLGRIVRCCLGQRRAEEPDLAQPLLSGDLPDGARASLRAAKQRLVSLLAAAQSSASDGGAESGLGVEAITQRVELVMDMVVQADEPKSLINAVREIKRMVPFEVDPLEDMPLLSAYMCSLRIRWSYFFLFALITSLAVFAGEITEVFFALFAANAAGADDAWDVTAQAWAMFWLLPFGVMLLALVGDEMSDLVLDAFDRPPLIWSLALVLAAVHRDRKLAPALRTCELVDFSVLFLTEGVPLMNALRCCLSGAGFWHGYMQGGLGAAFVAAGVTLLADFAICAHDVERGGAQQGGSAHQALRHMYHVLDKHKIFPGILSSRYDLFRAHFEQVSETPTACLRCRTWTRPLLDLSRGGRRFLGGILPVVLQPQHRLTVCLLLVWTVVSVLAMLGFSVILSAITMMLTVAVLSIKMTIQFPQVAGPFYNLVLVFFLCVALGLEAGTAFSISAEHITPLMTWGRAGGARQGYGLPSVWLGNMTAQAPYATCRIAWGSPDAPLSSLDLAALAWIAYEPDCSAIADLLSQSFGRLGWQAPQLEGCSPYESLPRWVSFFFPPGRLGGEGTRVFAVKGTSTWRDIYTDTKLFATIQVLQAFSKVVPILSLLPVPLVQSLIGSASRRSAESRLWEDLEQAVQLEAAASGRRARVVLTGHSLGGCVSQIVAARLQLPALVFSSPGVLYSARRFGLSVERARHVVAVVPDGDVVSRVDVHAAVVQNVACRGPDGLSASTRACHSLAKTACELWRACGDMRGRDFSQACAAHVAPRALMGEVYGDAPR